MGNQQAKQRKEVWYVKRLLSRVEADAIVDRHGNERTEPDVICELPGGQTLGIEVRLLLENCEALANSSIAHAVVRQAAERYMRMSADSVFASVHLTYNRIDNPSEVAIWIAETLAANTPTHNERFVWSFELDGTSDTPPAVTFMQSVRQPSSQFVLQIADWVNTEPIELIRTAIQDKQHKLTKLYRGCDLYWLLLVAEWERNTSFLELPRPPIELPANDFERVYYLDAFSGDAVLLG